jgi:hypothetical protein
MSRTRYSGFNRTDRRIGNRMVCYSRDLVLVLVPVLVPVCQNGLLLVWG